MTGGRIRFKPFTEEIDMSRTRLACMIVLATSGICFAQSAVAPDAFSSAPTPSAITATTHVKKHTVKHSRKHAKVRTHKHHAKAHHVHHHAAKA